MLNNERLPEMEGVVYKVDYPDYGDYPATTNHFMRREGLAYYKDSRYYIGWADIRKLPFHYLHYLKTVVLVSMEAKHVPIVFTFHVANEVAKFLREERESSSNS